MAEPQPQALTIPGLLDDYLVLTRLNQGGMANVYLAQTVEPQPHWVAIKTLLPSLVQRRRYVEMFRNEGELGQMLDHPNIVETLAVGSRGEGEQALHYLALGYVHGRDLGAVGRYFRKNGARMPLPQALYVAQEVLKGLEYAHKLADASGQALHLVNRDVSPANVMVGFEGEVKLIDFGIAQATLDFRSQIGAIRGKMSYMSPEQVRGLPVDARSDLFSLSVVLYQLLTGIEPFAADSESEQMELIRAHSPARPSEYDPSLPEVVDELLLCGLAKEPGARFADAETMRQAVARIREALELRCDQEMLGGMMRRIFRRDMEVISSRVHKAHALLRERGLHFSPARLPLEDSAGPREALPPLQAPRSPDSGELRGWVGGDTPVASGDDTPAEMEALRRQAVRVVAGAGPVSSERAPAAQAPRRPPEPVELATEPGAAWCATWVKVLLGGLGLCIVVLGAILVGKLL